MTKRGEWMGSQGRRAVFLDDGILVLQPSPRGEGAPKGRIGHRRYEREWENASQVDDLRKHPIHRSAVPLSPMGKANRWRLRRDPSTQVAAVLAFVISHTTFLAAQNDETGEKVFSTQQKRLSPDER